MATTAVVLVQDFAPSPEPALQLRAAPNLSLYELEDGLQALLDTSELVESVQQAEFAAALEIALVLTAAKRDRVGRFIAHCESQIALADVEIKRLQGRKKFFEAVINRVNLCVLRTIKNLGTDA